jgi:hypothetical protein
MAHLPKFRTLLFQRVYCVICLSQQQENSVIFIVTVMWMLKEEEEDVHLNCKWKSNYASLRTWSFSNIKKSVNAAEENYSYWYIFLESYKFL